MKSTVKDTFYDACYVWADPAGTCGLPATAAPIDGSPTGLPIGVQIIGPYLEDRTTIAFAELLERELGGFVPPPGVMRGNNQSMNGCPTGGIMAGLGHLRRIKEHRV